jgi:aldehyde:ferredoxin oxidoreductase
MFNIMDLSGKILKVDLTTQQVKIVEGEEELYRNFLSGRGLSQFLLFKNVKPEVSSLDSRNVLLLGAGLLVGTTVPGAVRLSVDTKNFFSGGVGSANAGGNFARELKSAGIGIIMVAGRAKQPVYIAVVGRKVTIRDATNLWGRTVSETDDVIRAELGKKAKVLCIGPAGENLVRGACVIVDKARAAAKCGVGAVMGSKRLKAVAVLGSEAIKVADPEGFLAVSKRAWGKVLKSKVVEAMNEHGTLSSVTMKNTIGGVPFRHYQDGYMDSSKINKIAKQAFKEYERCRFSAIGCPLRCRAIYEIREGPYAGTMGEAMEANTVQDFGYKLDISYPPAIIKANVLCNEYGIDMDTAAESIAWAYECYEKGILNEKDTNGLRLTWGNYEALMALIEQIAYRRGFGDILAEGVKKAADAVGKGSEELAMTMKGQDLYETMRMPKGYGLGAALATRGGGHCSGSPLTEFSPGAMSPEIAEEIYGVSTAGDPATYAGKAKLVAYHERLHAVLNSLGICFFVTVSEGPDLLTWEDLAKLVSTATGWAIDENDLMTIGERIHTLERSFNVLHAGFDRKNDYPPERFFKETIESGPFKGEKLDRAKFNEMLSENYRIHGWNIKGIPERGTEAR